MPKYLYVKTTTRNSNFGFQKQLLHYPILTRAVEYNYLGRLQRTFSPTESTTCCRSLLVLGYEDVLGNLQRAIPSQLRPPRLRLLSRKKYYDQMFSIVCVLQQLPLKLRGATRTSSTSILQTTAQLLSSQNHFPVDLSAIRTYRLIFVQCYFFEL